MTNSAHAGAGDLYFAYGSNLHPLRLARRLVAPRLVGSARLDGWVLDFAKRGRDGSGKCRIVPGLGCVHGALYALDAADKRRLDAIEGVGRGYACAWVELPRFGRVSTYVAMPGATSPALLPFDWYLGIVLAGAEFHGFPASYRSALADRPTLPDPDPARAAEHALLLATLRAAPA
jgi:gamma-glutamylcyclotransferase (GGCT)/AIG2-like uncharacterized protein YtfP